MLHLGTINLGLNLSYADLLIPLLLCKTSSCEWSPEDKLLMWDISRPGRWTSPSPCHTSPVLLHAPCAGGCQSPPWAEAGLWPSWGGRKLVFVILQVWLLCWSWLVRATCISSLRSPNHSRSPDWSVSLESLLSAEVTQEDFITHLGTHWQLNGSLEHAVST